MPRAGTRVDSFFFNHKGDFFSFKNNSNQFMFRPKTNCSRAYVLKMLTLSKNTAVILDQRAKGYHDLVELAQFVLSVLA